MSTLLDPGEAAEILAVSRFMVYKLVKTRQLGAYRVGTCVRISQDQIQEYLKRTAVQPKAATVGAAS